MAEKSASVRTGSTTARRQPGVASKSIPRTTDAGATGNVGGGMEGGGAQGVGMGETMNQEVTTGGPNSAGDVSKP